MSKPSPENPHVKFSNGKGKLIIRPVRKMNILETSFDNYNREVLTVEFEGRRYQSFKHVE